jgi:ammonia channel protein AmtB
VPVNTIGRSLDFAGGTVVHINAAVAGLVGAYMMGKRVGFGKEVLTNARAAISFAALADPALKPNQPT